MIDIIKKYEISEPELSEEFRYNVTMYDDFTYIEYEENEKGTDGNNTWKVKDSMQIPTNYAKAIGKILIETR